jgi:predicted amidohydrolase
MMGVKIQKPGEPGHPGGNRRGHHAPAPDTRPPAHLCEPGPSAGCRKGFTPDTISTDLTLNNYNHITIDMPTTLSKFVALGLSLGRVLRMSTEVPARLLLPDRGHGQLIEGGAADLALFEVESGSFTYEDYFGNTLRAEKQLACRGTIKDGVLLTPQEQEPMSLSFMRK